MSDEDQIQECCRCFLKLAQSLLDERGYSEDVVQAGLMGASIGRTIEQNPDEAVTWLRSMANQIENANTRTVQ